MVGVPLSFGVGIASAKDGSGPDVETKKNLARGIWKREIKFSEDDRKSYCTETFNSVSEAQAYTEFECFVPNESFNMTMRFTRPYKFSDGDSGLGFEFQKGEMTKYSIEYGEKGDRETVDFLNPSPSLSSKMRESIEKTKNEVLNDPELKDAIQSGLAPIIFVDKDWLITSDTSGGAAYHRSSGS